MGALTENHRCRGGTLSRISHALSTLVVGSGLGAIVCYAIEERPAEPLVLAAAALGVVLAAAVRQAVSGGRP
jgi:hypothetical protein